MAAILNSLQGILGSLGNSFQKVLDRIFPPEQRSEMMAKLQTFAINNPKLAAFLTTQIALTGLPLLLFAAFSVTVFLFSLIAALLVGVVAALLFTVFMLGVALVVVLPTVFLTTFAASFIYLWGLGGYYILKWFNEGEAPAPQGSAIGDKLNSLTGGRMSWLVDGARKKQDDARTGVDQTPKVHGSESDGKQHKSSNGNADGNTSSGAADAGKHLNEGKEQVTKQVDGVQKRVNKSTGGATNAAGTATGTAKGAISGATGLG
ncbi:hypothetical protein BS50DRAFT_545917 [Corynespora cassiicola Philippines]|uniref:Uncharacterized protein n=1 Tax=Corynespora cassiicola Philippines TaxID=1448308 RepID=A0A2T2NZS7_CORCC|nr:hypothetical protein BS50DRAFT_545917 [Corynespora cassiicola Philippines]